MFKNCKESLISRESPISETANMVPVTPPAINWSKRAAPGTGQRSRQKQKVELDPSGVRWVRFGQWNDVKAPGPFMYVDLSGTAFPLGFGNTFLAEHGFKLAQMPEAKIQKHSTTRSASPRSTMACGCASSGRTRWQPSSSSRRLRLA